MTFHGPRRCPIGPPVGHSTNGRQCHVYSSRALQERRRRDRPRKRFRRCGRRDRRRGRTGLAGDLVIEKRTYSPFVSSDIDAQLHTRSIERLYITGLHTDCCARHTSADAFQRGYDLVWVTDTLAAFTEEAHRAGIEYFKTWYATDPERQLRTTDQVIADWEAARAPEPEAVGTGR